MARKKSAEQEIRDQVAADLAAGKDPLGDDEDIVAESIEEQVARENAEDADEFDDQPAELTQAEEKVDEVEPDVAAAAAEPAADAKPADAKPADEDKSEFEEPERSLGETDTRALRDRGKPIEQLNSEEEKLLEAQGESFAALSDKKVTPAEYAKEQARISRALSAISTERAKVETNQQLATDIEMRHIQRILDRGTKAGLDYATDKNLQKQFDGTLQAMLSDPDNAGRSFEAIADDADAAIRLARGVKMARAAKAAAKAIATAAAKPPARSPPTAVVPTLRNIPAAATPNTGGGLLDHMRHLKGAAFNAAYAKLTQKQQAELLGE